MDKIKSEFALIDWIRQHSTENPGHITTGIGDDMAVIQLGSEELLITTDILLEDVHFDLARAELSQVGYKAMACSLSDCAAMASVPVAAVVAVALPNSMTMAQAQQLHQGLSLAADKYNCPIIGGDTTSWNKPLVVNVTMLSRCTNNKPVLRCGAQLGDTIMVTGLLGGSLAGRHLCFAPRIAEAQKLAHRAKLHAMIDLSDGLSSDLMHICKESNVSAIVDADAVPVSDAAQKTSDPLAAALSDGEDFELLFCVNPADADKLLKQWPGQSEVLLTQIGKITKPQKEPTVSLRRTDGTIEPLRCTGWEHFRE
jgi:thiamine-monophosphate kinase